MNAVFYISAAVALVSTAMVITRTSAIHALLYFVVSLLALAVVFYVLGAPFVAALEVIIYAGAIIVLFLFVVMLLNLGPPAAAQEAQWLDPWGWIGPSVLALILIGEMVYILLPSGGVPPVATPVAPSQVAFALLTRYLLGVELASILLLAGLVGAYHLGRHSVASQHEEGDHGRHTV